MRWEPAGYAGLCSDERTERIANVTLLAAGGKKDTEGRASVHRPEVLQRHPHRMLLRTPRGSSEEALLRYVRPMGEVFG